MEAQIIKCEMTHDIRSKMLWPHIKNNDYSIPIDKDPNTFHIGTFLKDKIISIGTFVKESNPRFQYKLQYRLRAMATDNFYQNKGAGSLVFTKGIEILKNKKIQLLWCDARINAIPFYKALNMTALEGKYMIKNIGMHKTMYIHLNS